MVLSGEVWWVEIDALLARACSVLGWDNLTVKGDWVIHDGKPVIIELAARLSGGFFASHFIPLSVGVPIIDYAIRLALRERVETPKTKMEQFVCQRYVFPAPEDIGRRVAYEPTVLTHDFPYTTMPRVWVGHMTSATEYKARPYPDIAHAAWFIRRGDTIRPVTDHAARWGQAIAVGASPQQARERAEAAVGAMKQGVILE